ncbi:unnamed protein product [Cylicocyclus nassatus]|uniref:Uncharacterized protein n=1 Tax=Cylicocyclus nassatus TaxID=53992 RepID=A0AA36GVS8_CYLNA|nr:unnamed protein product [Cylicocyclus nassatus]
MLSVLIVRCAGFLRSYKRVGASTIYTDLLLELNDHQCDRVHFTHMSPIKHESSFALQALCIIRQIMYKNRLASLHAFHRMD